MESQASQGTEKVHEVAALQDLPNQGVAAVVEPTEEYSVDGGLVTDLRGTAFVATTHCHCGQQAGNKGKEEHRNKYAQGLVDREYVED